MRRHILRTLAIMVALGLVPSLLQAVLVAPHAVFMDHASRSGQITLVNTGTRPEEVTVDLQFGYPDTDSLGNIFVRFIEEPTPDQPSAASWVRAFPRQLRLAPSQRQVVRLLAQPPEGLPDGEYWSRVIVTSRAAAVPTETVDTTVTVGLTVQLRTVISLTYRKGEVFTGVDLNELDLSVENDSLVAWVDLERTGNAAYLGQQTFTVTDSTGMEHARWSNPVAVYYATRRRMAFPLEAVEPGEYTIRFDLNVERSDLPPTNILSAPAITREVAVSVPARD